MSYHVKTYFEKPEKYLHKNFGIRIRKFIIDRLLSDTPTNKIILDVGCGDGSLSIDWLFNNKVYFCDFSKPMIDLVKARLNSEDRKNAHFLNTSLEELQLPDIPEIILCIGLLAHVPSVEGAINKLASLSGRNTILVLQFSDGDHLLNKFYQLGGGRSQKVNRIKENQLFGLLDKSGFSCLSIDRFQLLLPGMGRLPDNWLYAFQIFIQKIGLGSVLGQEIMLLLIKK
jgi:SAM-dependent methyltransferase